MDPHPATLWVKRNALQIESLACGADTSDLRPIQQILHDVTLVGFAEATHGTREFMQVRHRLLEFLVREMGFRALAIEASCAAAERVNEFVVNGTGDRSSALSGLGFLMWNVEEFGEVLDWLRRYNAAVEDAAKVRFYGLDIWNTEPSRKHLLAYLRIVAPDKVEPVEAFFGVIAAAEAEGMMRAHEHVDAGLLHPLRDLLQFLLDNSDTFALRTGASECRQIIQHLRLILQWTVANMTDEVPESLPSGVRPTATLNNFMRSRYMAENLLRVLQEINPPVKVIVWAHVFHLALGFPGPDSGIMPNMGSYLRERFGRRYYVFALELCGGEYLARQWLADNSLGEFATASLPPAAQDSWPWHLMQAGMQRFLLDLRMAATDAALRAWFTVPRGTHAVSWCYREPPARYTQRALADAYDGVIFIAQSSPTTPTDDARAMVAQKTGY